MTHLCDLSHLLSIGNTSRNTSRGNSRASSPTNERDNGNATPVTPSKTLRRSFSTTTNKLNAQNNSTSSAASQQQPLSIRQELVDYLKKLNFSHNSIPPSGSSGLGSPSGQFKLTNLVIQSLLALQQANGTTSVTATVSSGAAGNGGSEMDCGDEGSIVSLVRGDDASVVSMASAGSNLEQV